MTKEKFEGKCNCCGFEWEEYASDADELKILRCQKCSKRILSIRGDDIAIEVVAEEEEDDEK